MTRATATATGPRATFSRVAALTRRDLTIDFSYSFQMLLDFSGVFLSVLMFFFLGRLVGDAPELEQYGGGYFEFALIGLVVMGFSHACLSAFAKTIQSAQANGTLEILLSTATTVPVLMAGTLMVPLAFAAVEAVMYLGVGVVFTDLAFPFQGLAIASLLLVLTLGAFASLGIFSATMIVLTKRGDPVSVVVLQVTNLVAGALFPVTVMPEALQWLARAIPAFYGLRGTREVLLSGAGLGDVMPDILALLAFNVVLLPISLFVLKRALRIARVTGTLGNR